MLLTTQYSHVMDHVIRSYELERLLIYNYSEASANENDEEDIVHLC